MTREAQEQISSTVRRFPIESGHVELFARAIGDPNAAYRHSASPDSLSTTVTPPTFVVASAQFDEGYELRPRIGEPWFGSGRNASGVPDRPKGSTLHAEQHFEYHRPLRPGDVLTANTRTGARWKKEGRSGTLVFQDRITEYFDEAGELVVTSRSVTVTPSKS
jgi:hypothetical protein